MRSSRRAVFAVCSWLDDQAVDHRLDGVHLVAVEFDLLVHVAHLAVDAHAHEARLAHVLEDRLVLALAVLDQRRQDQHAAAVGQLQDGVDDLLAVCWIDLAAAAGAVRHADAGEEQAQVVVDLGDGADGRARVAAGALLVDGDGRAEALDLVDVGLLHLAQELAGVGGERFDVAALALGVDGVEGQAWTCRSRTGR